jgi:predicted component of type VI protein secretion system
MPAQLLALTEGSNILLDKPILLLGRHPECDIQLNSRKISRRHCCIAQVHDYLIVRDLGSTNGIRINGDRVVEGKLKPGDELTIGNFRYQICWDMPGDPGGDAGRESAKRPAPKPAKQGMKKPIDMMLEDADEPIPLDEDVAVSRILSAKPAGKEPPPARPPQPPGTISEAQIIPDDLSLLPPSGSFGLQRDQSP